MLSTYDYCVIAFYFVFMLAIGWVFKKFCNNTSDYFRGGGKMQWWMAGCSAFMVAFSAWTFTGAASKAYTDGTIILIIFIGNAVGFFINFLWFAPRFRQMRVITPMQAVRERFGPANEQFFTWLQVPLGILYAGIWLNGLGIFLAAVFGFNLQTTIIVVGTVVMIMSVTGGSWAVVASDFMQVLILMPVSIVAAFLALNHPAIGGLGGFFDKLPKSHFDWTILERTDILFFWIVAVILQKLVSTNNLLDSSRYLCVKDSSQARKAALLASIMFLIGPLVWFIPPMVSTIVFPDLTAVFPKLGAKASEAAYVAISLDTMPMGMAGLLVSGIFAATMSSMDSGLNRNAGIFVKNFYQPVLRRNASDTELLKAGKATTCIFGMLVVLAALNFSRLKGLGLFDLMLQFGALIALPYSIPLVLGVIFKKAPHWSGWTTVLVGLAASLIIKLALTPELIQDTFGWGKSLSTREFKDCVFAISVIGNAIIGSGWFLLTCVVDGKHSKEYKVQIEAFFAKAERPVLPNEEPGDTDVSQCVVLGRMCLCYGGFIILLTLIPNSISGRFAFVFCGGVILIIGLMLLKSAKNQQKNLQQGNTDQNKNKSIVEFVDGQID
jgi:SSS family transporter